jgi:hypothetical protein
MSIVEMAIQYTFNCVVYPMLEHLREQHYQQGRCDRDAGLLPRMQGSAYLEGYLKGRPEGLDGVIRYFPTIESYLSWKYKDSETPKL